MIELNIGLDGVPNSKRLQIGNKYENNDEVIKFILPIEFENYKKYVISVIKKNNEKVTKVFPITDNQFFVSTDITYISGSWSMYLMCRENEIDLEAKEVDISANNGEHVFISDGFIGVVSDSDIDKEFVDNIPMDTNLHIVYEDLLKIKQELIDKINTPTSYNDLVDVPTKVSQFENDKKYQTEEEVTALELKITEEINKRESAITKLKEDLVDLSDNVGFILTNRKKVVSTSAGGYISVFDSLSFKKQMKYTFVLSFSPTTNADTYFYLTENGSNIVSKGINSGTTEYSFDYVPTSDKEGIVARWYCNSPNIECMTIMSVEQEKMFAKVSDAVEKSTKAYSVIEKYYFETYDYVEQTVSLESNYINSAGNSINGYNHITISNVKFGEKYKFKNKVGANMVAYVIKDRNGHKTRAYTSEDWITTHDYDIEIEVAESENGGTIYINTADENFIGLKKYEAYFKKKTSLYGKKLSVAGDSICAGAGYLGGYGKIIADENNMTFQNVGIGGSTIADYASDRGKICNMISQLNSDADYVLINGGVNDASLGVPIGTMTDRFDSDYDKTTFIGAMESICKELTNKFNGKKIAFILVHKMTNKYSNFYTGEDNYYIAQKKVLEKWGIPYVDLNVTTPPLNYISSLANVYTNNGDGWHPNYLGYTTFYIPKILSLLESI